MEQQLWEYGDMDAPKVDSIPPSHPRPTYIHIIGGIPDHLLNVDHDTADEVREW